MDNSEIKFSVITVVKNGLPYLETALESYKKQKYKNKELIVVYSNSIDSTKNFLIKNQKNIDVLKFDDKSTNKFGSINYAINFCSGNYIGVLHSDDIVRKETLNINKGVALTSTSEFFEDLARGNGPKNSILALGYSGWQAGQLESEIIQNSWMSLAVETSFLFDDDVSRKWNNAYKLIGIDPSSLSSVSGKA